MANLYPFSSYNKTASLLSRQSGSSSNTQIPSGEFYSNYLYWDDVNKSWKAGDNKVNIGRDAGYINSGDNIISIGNGAGNQSQGINSIAIGLAAGYYNQGNNSIAIGPYAGEFNQPDNSIVLNATNTHFSPTGSSSLFIKPIRGVNTIPLNGYPLYYIPSNGEILYYDPSL
jgi:hypothetical protein